MTRVPELIDVNRLQESLDNHRTLPPVFFSDAEIYEFERSHVFGRAWYCLGLTSRLRRAADRITAQITDVPVVLVRGDDGLLRGFVNICRHRGHTVACSDESSKTLTCPYHGWTYRLDGQLAAAPRSAGDRDFDASKIGLLPIATDEHRGLVFANLDVDALPLADANPAVIDTLDRLPFDFSNYEFHRSITWEIEANWKVWFENASECYHCPLVHRTSFGAEVGDVDLEVTDDLFHLRFATRPGRPGYQTLRFWPGWSIVGRDDEVLSIGRDIQVGPQATQNVVQFYGGPGSSREVLADYEAMYDQTTKEDVEIVETVQKNLNTGRLAYGLPLTNCEGTLDIHQLVVNAYRTAIAGPQIAVADGVARDVI
jgi:nitrite reductase/ring-hydroxylating ferredoxin subunit